MTPFEPGKEYRTRDGRRARVYAVDGADNRPIHGAILDGNWDGNKGWCQTAWFEDGRYFSAGGGGDLIPPRKTLTLWVNIYPKNIAFSAWTEKRRAKQAASKGSIARKKVTIEYQDGEYDE